MLNKIPNETKPNYQSKVSKFKRQGYPPQRT